jgi:glycosyltransferase involved in cell wall biosynthesis
VRQHMLRHIHGGMAVKVSVILTSYNRPRQVVKAVASVRAQTHSDWELFIVDDNSNEETKAVLSAIATYEPRCTVIHSGVMHEERAKTTRYATCINLAIPKLTGDLVSYLTDDDIYYPERFQKMVEIFERRPDIFVVYGSQRVITVKQGRITAHQIRPLVGVTRSPASLIDHNSIMHRRSCFEVVPCWDDHPAHWGAADAVFFTLLAEHWDFHPVNFITDEHRLHHDSVQVKLFHSVDPWDGDFEN